MTPLEAIEKLRGYVYHNPSCEEKRKVSQFDKHCSCGLNMLMTIVHDYLLEHQINEYIGKQS